MVMNDDRVNNLIGFEARLPVIGPRNQILKLVARFDKSWSIQNQPDPPVPPTSHITRIRAMHEYSVVSAGLGNYSWIIGGVDQ